MLPPCLSDCCARQPTSTLTEEDRRFLNLDDQQPGSAAEKDSTDHLAAAYGLVLGSLLAVPMWFVIGVTFYLLLRCATRPCG